METQFNHHRAVVRIGARHSSIKRNAFCPSALSFLSWYLKGGVLADKANSNGSEQRHFIQQEGNQPAANRRRPPHPAEKQSFSKASDDAALHLGRVVKRRSGTLSYVRACSALVKTP